MLILNKYFYKNNKSKLCIGDRVAVLNDMFYEYGGSTTYIYILVPPNIPTRLLLLLLEGEAVANQYLSISSY
jgi:hypothetical protein